jgi:arginine/ornithine N-succinyltransferase beta subunit
VFIHTDDIRSVHDARIRRECAASKLEEERLIANKDQLVMRVLFRPTDATWDYLCGTVVAAHCIECKADAA